MNFRKWINKSEELQKKYAYYLSLGYSDTAAKVLSVVTYGDSELVFLVNQIGKKNVIENLYFWLHAREESSPEDAISAYYEEKHPSPKYEEWGVRRSFCFGSAPNPPSPAPSAFCELGDDDAELAFDSPMLGAGVAEAEESETFDCLYSLAPRSFASLKAAPVIMESLSTDAYEPIEEKDSKSVFTAPTSTFRMTTSNASMGVVFNQIRSGRRVNMDQVRIEEVLNYFDYEVEAPKDAKFKISTEILEKKGNKKLLFIDAQAANEKRDQQNIILLLDTSGSMSSNDEVTQEAIATILSKLNPGDRISLITYSTEDHTIFEGFEIKDSHSKEDLMGIILGLEIDGCTFGSAGIETAYAIGEKLYKPDWNNQVILITDGDLNFGITDKHGLKDLIEEKKKSHLFLSVIGTGLFNYKDDNLEVLSKHGNGTYCVVNSLEDVDESINRHFIALTNIVAKDVKAQVEFNPRFVKAYRLLGYENRQLNHEDFKNDAVISEPYGSGGHGIALYELVMSDGEDSAVSSDLKYQKPVLTDSDELGTVSIRYKEPLGDESFPIETVVYNTNHSTQNAQLAYFLYCLSEKLRGSKKLDEYDEQFFDVMITSSLYKNFSGPNKEKIEMLVDAFLHNAERKESSSWSNLPF